MHIILGLVQTIVFAAIVLALVSYILWRYEVGNRAGRADGEKISAARGAFYIARETAALLLAIILYPLGWIPGGASVSRLRHGQRPVILCHGYMHNRSAFFLLGYRLRKAGWINTIAPNFKPAAAEVSYFAERLSETVSLALQRSGCEKVDLIGHSMGGLVVRYFIEMLGGAERVNCAITLGSPHMGAKTAALAFFKSAEKFRPDSSLIAELKRSADSGGAAMTTAIWSDFDSVVLPPENSRLPEPFRSVEVSGLGHVGLLYSGRVFRETQRIMKETPQ
jgi:triacylglycerol esterase/lipase EstA (alpha/beta hydrolase family)